MEKKVLIVGGVAGGASTAARLRRLDESLEIVLFEKGEYISFANCGLPYYIGGVIPERESLLVQTVDSMHDRFNLDIRVFSEVTGIDRQNKKVFVKNHQTGAYYEETYDTLVLSPGAKPIIPPIEGILEASNLFTLRNIPDTDKIKQYIETHRPKNAIVVGAGFIGLEMVENLKHLGLDVTLIEASNQVMPPIDYEMASILHGHLLENKVNLLLNDSVIAFKENGRKVAVSSGKEIAADMIILSIGVAPETAFVKNTGLEMNERGALIVNEWMQTSDENIYALGDAVAVNDFVTKTSTMIPLAWPANRQGRLVADHINGSKRKYTGTLGSSVAKVFDYTVASTGVNEKTLKNQRQKYDVLHIHPGSHAGYYPGATPTAFKLLFDPETGAILGGQGVGLEGVEKRIDLLSVAIKANFTVYDLQDIEPCYAPPYNSAKDPVNMMGYYAANKLDGLVETIGWDEVDEKIVQQKGIVLDVRESHELISGMMPNTVHIPLGELRQRMNELPKNQVLYTTCQVGLRGYTACRMLTQHGFQCKNIDGGIRTYFLVKNAENSLKK